jgi:hypothetical protein
MQFPASCNTLLEPWRHKTSCAALVSESAAHLVLEVLRLVVASLCEHLQHLLQVINLALLETQRAAAAAAAAEVEFAVSY